MKKISISIAVALFALAGATQAFGSYILAYTDPSGAGNQAYTGNLASIFQVNSPITVSALGIFDATPLVLTSGFATITGSTNIEVGIYNLGTDSLLTSTYFDAGSAYPMGGTTNDVLKAVTPVVLVPGLYEVDAIGFNPDYLNGNAILGSPAGSTANSGGGDLTFLGVGWDSGYPIPIYNKLTPVPTCPWGCLPAPSPQDTQFDAGTFVYESATAPEPGTLLLMGTGVLGLAGMVRRKFRKTA